MLFVYVEFVDRENVCCDDLIYIMSCLELFCRMEMLYSFPVITTSRH